MFFKPNIEKLKSQKNIKKLIRALNYKDGSVRIDAAYALGEIGDTQAVEALLNLLTSDSHYQRKAAIWAMGEIRDPRCIDPVEHEFRKKYDLYIKGKTSDEQWTIEYCAYAIESLSKLVGAKGANKLVEFSNLIHPYAIRLSAVKGLSEINEAAMIPFLLQFLGDFSAKIVELAVQALDRLGEGKWMPMLIKATNKVGGITDSYDNDRLIAINFYYYIMKDQDPRLRSIIERDWNYFINSYRVSSDYMVREKALAAAIYASDKGWFFKELSKLMKLDFEPQGEYGWSQRMRSARVSLWEAITDPVDIEKAKSLDGFSPSKVEKGYFHY